MKLHRYTIDFPAKSSKKWMELAMTSVEGIGPARAKALFTAFKTQKAMREATVEELAAVKGMTSPVLSACMIGCTPMKNTGLWILTSDGFCPIITVCRSWRNRKILIETAHNGGEK